MLTGADIQALKDYVSAPGNNGQNQSDSTVRLHVTHSNLKAEFMDIRLNLYVSQSVSWVRDPRTSLAVLETRGCLYLSLHIKPRLLCFADDGGCSQTEAYDALWLLRG